MFWRGAVRPNKGKRSRKSRPSVRHLSRQRVLEIVREHIVEESSVVARHGQSAVTVEGIATQFRLHPAKVHWAFMVLNREGWLTQGHNHAPHDSPRDHFAGGGDSAWSATVYYLKKQRVQQRNPCGEIPLPDSPRGAVFVYDEEVPPPKKRYSKRLQRRVR